jgi:hypothetical protein
MKIFDGPRLPLRTAFDHFAVVIAGSMFSRAGKLSHASGLMKKQRGGDSELLDHHEVIRLTKSLQLPSGTMPDKSIPKTVLDGACSGVGTA